MDRTSSRILLALVTVMCATGCSPPPPDYDPGWHDEDPTPNTPSWGDLPDPDGKQSDTPSPSAVQRRMNRERELMTDMFCQALFRCTPDQVEGYRLWRARYSSERECQQLSWFDGTQNEGFEAETLALVESGRIALDIEKTDACLDEAETDLDRLGQLCKSDVDVLIYGRRCLSFSGLVPIGGACRTHDECEGHDVRCSNASATCGGTCKRGPTQCDPMCEARFYCNPDTDRCEPLTGEGQSCESVDCSPGLYCTNGDEPRSRICKPIKKEGERCEESNACEIGLTCIQHASLQICVRPAEKGQPCQRGSCRYGLLCDEQSGRCVVGLPLDAPCERVGQCNAETICELGTCVPLERDMTAPARAGEPCMDVRGQDSFVVCETGLYCIRDGGEFERICSTLPTQEGDVCTSLSGTCAVGMECESGVCVSETRVEPGESCANATCIQSFCGPQDICITTDPCGAP